MCVTLMGQTLRVHVNAISVQGRNAAGVKVVSMKFTGDSIVAIASTVRDDEEEVQIPEQAPIEEEVPVEEEDEEDVVEEDAGAGATEDSETE